MDRKQRSIFIAHPTTAEDCRERYRRAAFWYSTEANSFIFRINFRNSFVFRITLS